MFFCYLCFNFEYYLLISRYKGKNLVYSGYFLLVFPSYHFNNHIISLISINYLLTLNIITEIAIACSITVKCLSSLFMLVKWYSHHYSNFQLSCPFFKLQLLYYCSVKICNIYILFREGLKARDLG